MSPYISDGKNQDTQWIDDVDKRLCYAIKEGWNLKLVRGGDAIVVITGWKAGSGHTNTVRIIHVPKGDQPPEQLLAGGF